MQPTIKTILVTAAVFAATVGPAEARSNVSIGIGVPVGGYYAAPAYNPYYYPPAPVVYQPAPYYTPYYPVYYRDGYYRHREYDWGYWHDRPAPYRGPYGR